MGILNDNLLSFVRNNIPQIKFLFSHIVAYKNLYFEKGGKGGYMGMQ